MKENNIHDLHSYFFCEDLQLYRGLAIDALSRLRCYLNTLEEFISKEKGYEIKELKKKAKNLSESLQSEFWAWEYPVHWKDIFESHLRSSFVVSLISLFEFHLNTICSQTSFIANSPLKMKELRGKNIFERARKFLKIFGGYVKPTEQNWNTVELIYEVRNCFVHNNGMINEVRNKKLLKDFIEERSDISERHGHIEIDAEFCAYAIDTIEDVIHKLYEELGGLCNRVRFFKSKE